jgi:hypothetical protein
MRQTIHHLPFSCWCVYRAGGSMYIRQESCVGEICFRHSFQRDTSWYIIYHFLIDACIVLGVACTYVKNLAWERSASDIHFNVRYFNVGTGIILEWDINGQKETSSRGASSRVRGWMETCKGIPITFVRLHLSVGVTFLALHFWRYIFGVRFRRRFWGCWYN